MKFSHRGRSLYRLKTNPVEKAFSDEWYAEHAGYGDGSGHGIVDFLLGDGKDPRPATEEEDRFAATIVQWFGSPVGQGFLESVLDRPDARQLRARLSERWSRE